MNDAHGQSRHSGSARHDTFPRYRDLSGYPASQHDLARAFSDRFGGRFRFDHTRGQWFEFKGVTYQPEETQYVRDLIRELCCEHWQTEKDAKRSDMRLKAQTYRDVETILRADRRHAISARDWNADPWVLATPAGVVDLTDGTTYDASLADLFNRSTAVVPAETADCPRWQAFIREITCGDNELAGFLKRAAGYTLTGSTQEECLFFGFGEGENGKGVLVSALKAILGDYAKTAEMDFFMVTPHERHLTHLARLAGARFVTASETEVGRRWALSKVKELTGNEGPVTAAFMRQDAFEFRPEFKLWFIGNARPAIPKVDKAIRRRMNLIPFRYQPTYPDPDLKARLVEEYPGILRWMIDGCLEWQTEGLRQPLAVIEATDDYLDEEDLLGRWLKDRCICDRRFVTPLSHLTADFKAWAEANGERAMPSKRLAREILARSGFTDEERSNKGRMIGGLALAADREPLAEARGRPADD